MNTITTVKKLAIAGGGPAALFIVKRLLEAAATGDTGRFSVDIFESGTQLGVGMPYGNRGANQEHVTNVSGNEIPKLQISLLDWVKSLSPEHMARFGLNKDELTDYMVLPRLLFGDYLRSQFDLLLVRGRSAGIDLNVFYNSTITDIRDQPEAKKVIIRSDDEWLDPYDHVFICTGHQWPKKKEGEVRGYFDSPYPPAKLEHVFNHPVAIMGAALTAIDAVRTLARCNGSFIEEQPHQLKYVLDPGSPDFRLALHSIAGLLPGIRFHLEDSHLSNESLLTREEILEHLVQNNGFLSLDYIFEKDFKDSFREHHMDFYEQIRDLSMEEFVDKMMAAREDRDPMELFREEYREAEQSIRRRESVYWKEAIGALSFAMNYPAKHFSAEDMQRLQKTLMPLISIIIAYVPQSSCEELMALHDAGVLSIVAVDKQSKAEPQAEGGIVYHYKDRDGIDQAVPYKTFISAIGQPRLEIRDFPFRSLVKDGTVSEALLKFRSVEVAREQQAEGAKEIIEHADGSYYLKVAGLAITDNFKAISATGFHNERVRIMAVPFIGGYNPDYSGLDFCEEASRLIVEDLFNMKPETA